MTVNPTRVTWTAPTENEDGTPIDYELSYDVGKKLADGSFVPIYTTPGSLNPDGTYEAPIAEMGFEDGKHEIAMRAFRVDVPTLRSVWSNTVQFEVEVNKPGAPLDVTVVA